MIKKIVFFIGVILLLATCLLSQETKYSFIGCIVFMGLISLLMFKDLYKYTQRRREIQEAYFNLRRSNVFWELGSCAYFSIYFIINFLIKSTEVLGPKEYIMAASILIYSFLGVYSVILKKPMMNENGILFSNGDFVVMNNIEKVDVQEERINHNKKLIFYCNNKFYTLKVKKCDYENIRDFINVNEEIKFCEI